jgi:(p)ppGpp synthase/HD superfamily hydrolase
MASLQISMVSTALQYMPGTFKGQMDKTGREQQFLHSLRVYDLVKKATTSEIAQTAALLHDVIEDTDQTENDLRRVFKDYPTEDVEKMIQVVLSVTRGYIERRTHAMVFVPPPAHLVCNCDKSKSRRCTNDVHVYDKETYREFVMRSKRNPLGRIVKIADITDNSTPERTEGLREDEKGIVQERYIPALAFLKDNQATEYFTPKQLARPCKFCTRPRGEHKGADLLCPVKMLFSDAERQRYKGVKN